ncbi:MAG: OprD family outer membrane porin [Campylobacterota bacterium]|nr:OprD family outer membrane porin [Campylobacterota bacterium]
MKQKIFFLTMLTSLMGTSLMAAPETDVQSVRNLLEEPDLSGTTQQQGRGPRDVRSVRNILGEFNPVEHTKFQIRTGYINLNEEGSAQSSAYALGGHFHLNTKRWNGLKLGASLYTVLNLGINQNPLSVNPDFFDANDNSFALFSEAFIEGRWGNTEIKAGRQSLETPHADSDDIRMMPNYFTAYTINNNDIDGLTLSAGLITQMAGWENGIDSSKFVNIDEVLGTGADTDGIYYAAATYEGIENLELSLWYYNFDQISNVLYAEAAYQYAIAPKTILSMGLQYESASATGDALLGDIDSNTFGARANIKFKDLGLRVLAAYNKVTGDTGVNLSLGGGPFFTSMEDQTLDAIERPGTAWMVGTGFNFKKIGIEGLIIGLAYGHFEADDDSLHAGSEFDAVLNYALDEKLTITAAFASIDHEIENSEDSKQFRIIANYNF